MRFRSRRTPENFSKSCARRAFDAAWRPLRKNTWSKPALTRLGIRDYFEFVLTCTELGSGKDEPAIFEEALRRLGTAKDETVVFEDAVHAIRTAKKAGFRVVALYDDSAAEDAEEIKEIADRYCRSFAECEVESL